MATNAVSETVNHPTAWDGKKRSRSSDTPTLTPPTLSQGVVGNVVTISWTGGYGDIVIERSTTSTSSGFSTVATIGQASGPLVQSGLLAGNYYYRARSLINGQYSASYSSVVTATVAAAGGGAFADGDYVTITIPGGGSNVDASLQGFLGGSWGYVESNTVGADFDTNTPVQWNQVGADGPVITDVRSLNGVKAMVNDRTGGAYQFGARFDHGASQRVQLGIYSYFLENPSNNKGQLKFHRFVGAINTYGGIHDANQPNHYITFFDPDHPDGGSGTYMPVNNSTLGGSNVNRQEDAGSSGVPVYGYYAEGVWVTIETYSIHNSDPALSDGTVRVVARREDTQAIIADYTWSNQRLDYGGADRGRWFVLQLYMGNGFDNSAKVFIDRDVYVSSNTSGSTIPKYIMMGNAATYAACTIRTICPYTSWVNSSGDAVVNLRVNRGRHPSLSGVYFYGMAGPNNPINTTGVQPS